MPRWWLSDRPQRHCRISHLWQPTINIVTGNPGDSPNNFDNNNHARLNKINDGPYNDNRATAKHNSDKATHATLRQQANDGGSAETAGNKPHTSDGAKAGALCNKPHANNDCNASHANRQP
ncbi:MAG: hypothetical protein K8963_07265, partial [Proteobacteria bacterium]|nr:hypothetical protein [Pseudomonadota bacterium]